MNGSYTAETTAPMGSWSPWEAYATAWPVTDIVSPTGDQVHFSYNTVSEVMSNPTNITLSVHDAIYSNNPGPGTQVPSSISSSAAPGLQYNTFFVNQITTPKEKVVFVGAQRTDPLNLTANQYYFKEIDVYSAANNNQLLKKVKFYTSRRNPHWILDSLQVCDSTKVIQTYRFDYYDLPDMQQSDPYRFTNYYADQWGYYHLGGLGSGYESIPYLHNNIAVGDYYLPNLNGIPGPQPIEPYLTRSAVAEQVNKTSADTNSEQAFTLKRITFPTGGYRDYQFESNVLPGNVYGGGIRVRQIKSYDNLGNVLTRLYKYGTNENGIGNISMFVDSSCFKNVSAINTGYSYSYSTSLTGDANVDEHLGLFYPQVDVYDYSSSGGVSGKTVYNFSKLSPDFSFRGDMYNRLVPNAASGLNVSDYEYWQKPVMLSSYIYSSAPGGTFSLIHSSAYNYNTLNVNVYRGLKVALYNSCEITAPPDQVSNPHISGFAPQQSPYYTSSYLSGTTYVAEAHPFSFYCWMPYTLGTGMNVVSSDTETDYSTAGQVVSVKQYDYNSYGQKMRTTVLNSDGKQNVQEFRYPLDYPGITNNSDPYSVGINNLLTANAVDKVVEESDYVIGTNNQKTLISSELNQYKSNMPVMTETDKLFTNSPLSNFVSSSVSGGTFQKDSRYIAYYLYSAYDTIGNIREARKLNGPKDVYLWGYNHEYPVARISGSDYVTVSSIVNQLQIDAATSIVNNDAAVRTLLNTLRTSLTSAQVFTYTYDPLIGMTSSTDAKGETTYYEYDAFQRLMNIKNKDGNIIKHFDYHYQGQ